MYHASGGRANAHAGEYICKNPLFVQSSFRVNNLLPGKRESKDSAPFSPYNPNSEILSLRSRRAAPLALLGPTGKSGPT